MMCYNYVYRNVSFKNGDCKVQMRSTVFIKLNMAEMAMFRWMCGGTKMDRIRNDRMRDTMKVGETSKKMREGQSGTNMRRDEEYVGKE